MGSPRQRRQTARQAREPSACLQHDAWLERARLSFMHGLREKVGYRRAEKKRGMTAGRHPLDSPKTATDDASLTAMGGCHLILQLHPHYPLLRLLVRW